MVNIMQTQCTLLKQQKATFNWNLATYAYFKTHKIFKLNFKPLVSFRHFYGMRLHIWPYVLIIPTSMLFFRRVFSRAVATALCGLGLWGINSG